MQLAFCLYKYFPFGGMQRNFLRIALACQARGHDIRVYSLDWQGEVPEGFELVRVPVRAWANHRRYRKFTDWVQADLARRPVDRVVGFNKMPGLDVYYAGDPCFEQKARALRGRFYRFSPRYRHFSAYERAVFDPTVHTRILMMSPVQKPMFVEHYGTPEHRFHLLPPGIARDRRAPPPSCRGRRRAAGRGTRPDRCRAPSGRRCRTRRRRSRPARGPEHARPVPPRPWRRGSRTRR